MVEYIVANNKHLALLMKIRIEFLRIVNNLSDNFVFDDAFIDCTKEYFLNGNQTTVLAKDTDIIACATICYLNFMPTYSHQTGKRAHLSNVYVNEKYRRKGIAQHMIQMLIDEARKNGVTEITLGATDMGRPLYEKCGFKVSDETMVMTL